MKPRYLLRAYRLIALAALMACLAVEARAAELVFVTTGGGGAIATLNQIDPTTGAVVATVGSLGVSNSGIAFDPTTNILWGVSGPQDLGSPIIYTIDLTTGATTPVGETGLDWGLSDISFRSDGRLYGRSNCRESGGSALFLIDKSTGAASLVGTSPGTTDGFYRVSAGDNCSSAAEPILSIGTHQLAAGETIKITQTPGKAGVRLVNTMGPEQIKHFQVGPGDAVITATDGSGNQTSVTCLVPPPPK